MTTFKEGDRVARNFNKINPEDDYLFLGEVKAVSSNGDCLVEWDEDWLDSTKYYPSTSLLSEKEAEEKYSKLGKEFNDLKIQLETKVSGASKILQEAADLAALKGFKLRDFYEVARPLKRVIDAAGWSSSSMNC